MNESSEGASSEDALSKSALSESASSGRASSEREPSALRDLVGAELNRTAPTAVLALAAELARRAGPGAHSVLFYGSALAAPTLDGILDFYVLLDESPWPGSRLGALAHRALPPRVGYLQGRFEETQLSAKYALMRHSQFKHRMRRAALDTTLWARFSQPSICVWQRSARAAREVSDAVECAVLTAAYWGAVLGPFQGAPTDFWRAVYSRTYAAELRVEGSQRSSGLVSRRADYFDAVLRPAWRALDLSFDEHLGEVAPKMSAKQQAAGARGWRVRVRCAKPLNLLRLIKAAFTFEGAADYVAWKVQRHSGVQIDVQPWQRRFPLLAAPAIYWQLRRRGVLR